MADLRKLISSGILRKRKYHENRLRCEKLGLRIEPLSNKVLENRVLRNTNQLKNHLHPKGDIANSFVLTEEMLLPLEILDSSRDFWYVEDAECLTEMCGILKDKKTIAFDTELDVEFSYHPLTALIQISCDTHDFVIDTIPIFDQIKWELGRILSNEKILKVVFSPNDLLSLQRDFDIFCCSVIDFQNVILQLTKRENVSFEQVVQWYHDANYQKDENEQLFLFRLRPLPKNILEYAKNDSKFLLFCWEKLKSIHKEFLLKQFNFSHCRYWMLRIWDFKPKTATKCWNKLVKSLNIHQKKLFTKEKYWFTFCKLYNWRENTAKLRNTRPNRVLSRWDMIMFCVVKPKNINMLNSIWSKYKENSIATRESLVYVINDERKTVVMNDDLDSDSDDMSKAIYNHKEDDSACTATESMDIEEVTVCETVNDSGYMENDEIENVNNDDTESVKTDIVEINLPIEKVQEKPVDNPFDKICNDKLISNTDVLNNFELILKSKMPKYIVNRLRRRRKRLRHPLINADRARRGEAAIDFHRKRTRK